MAEKTLKIILQAVIDDGKKKLEALKNALAEIGSDRSPGEAVKDVDGKVESLGKSAKKTAKEVEKIGAAAKSVEKLSDATDDAKKKLEETAEAAEKLPPTADDGVKRFGGLKKVFSEIRTEMNNTAGSGKKILGQLVTGGGSVMIILAGIASLIKLCAWAFDEFGGAKALREQQKAAADMTAELQRAHSVTEQMREANTALGQKLADLASSTELSVSQLIDAEKAAQALQSRYGDLGITVDRSSGSVRMMGDSLAKLSAAQNGERTRELEAEIKSLRGEAALAAKEIDSAGLSIFGLFNVGGEQKALDAAEKQAQLMGQINEKLRERNNILKADPEKERQAAAKKLYDAEAAQLEILRLRIAGRTEEAAALADRVELEKQSATLTQRELDYLLRVRAEKRKIETEEEERRKGEEESLRKKEAAEREAAEAAQRRKAEAEQARRTLAGLDEADWRDAMSDKIRGWQKEIDLFRDKSSKARAELSRFGVGDGAILKSKQEIRQQKADETLRDKIARQNSGEKVRFSKRERDRIAELEAQQRQARADEDEAKRREGASRNAQGEMDQRNRENVKRDRDAARRDAEAKLKEDQSPPPQQPSSGNRPPGDKPTNQARPENVERGRTGTENIPGIVKEIRDMLHSRLPGE